MFKRTSTDNVTDRALRFIAPTAPQAAPPGEQPEAAPIDAPAADPFAAREEQPFDPWAEAPAPGRARDLFAESRPAGVTPRLERLTPVEAQPFERDRIVPDESAATIRDLFAVRECGVSAASGPFAAHTAEPFADDADEPFFETEQNPYAMPRRGAAVERHDDPSLTHRDDPFAPHSAPSLPGDLFPRADDEAAASPTVVPFDGAAAAQPAQPFAGLRAGFSFTAKRSTEPEPPEAAPAEQAYDLLARLSPAEHAERDEAADLRWNPFKAPDADPFAAPAADPFAAPADDPFAARAADPFAAPVDDQFAMPAEEPSAMHASALFAEPQADVAPAAAPDPFSAFRRFDAERAPEPGHVAPFEASAVTDEYQWQAQEGDAAPRSSVESLRRNLQSIIQEEPEPSPVARLDLRRRLEELSQYRPSRKALYVAVGVAVLGGVLLIGLTSRGHSNGSNAAGKPQAAAAVNDAPATVAPTPATTPKPTPRPSNAIILPSAYAETQATATPAASPTPRPQQTPAATATPPVTRAARSAPFQSGASADQPPAAEGASAPAPAPAPAAPSSLANIVNNAAQAAPPPAPVSRAPAAAAPAAAAPVRTGGGSTGGVPVASTGAGAAPQTVSAAPAAPAPPAQPAPLGPQLGSVASQAQRAAQAAAQHSQAPAPTQTP